MKMNPIARILMVLVGTVILLLIGKFTSIGEWFNLENISEVIKTAGPWGFLMFASLFVLGSLLQIPAMVFVLAAILIYGPVNGTVLGYLGVIIAMFVNYLVVKKVGGNPLGEFKHKRIRKILSHLDQNPLGTIILLRLIFWASPMLNCTLAMTGVKARHYLLGSSIGIIIPLLLFSVATQLFSHVIIRYVS